MDPNIEYRGIQVIDYSATKVYCQAKKETRVTRDSTRNVHIYEYQAMMCWVSARREAAIAMPEPTYIEAPFSLPVDFNDSPSVELLDVVPLIEAAVLAGTRAVAVPLGPAQTRTLPLTDAVG